MTRAKRPESAPDSPIAVLTSAAQRSIKIPPDSQSGLRRSDPLAALVTDETWQEWRPVAETITGAQIDREGPGDRAARVRSAMRRWAARR